MYMVFYEVLDICKTLLSILYGDTKCKKMDISTFLAVFSV